MAKEFPGRRPICFCFKAMDHEFLDFPRMIAEVERMNMRQEDHEKYQATEIMTEPQKESKKSIATDERNPE
jgi:hypothetical protein